MEEKKWYKSWWGYLLLLVVWPVSLSFWIWKKEWDIKLRIGAITILWIFVLTFLVNQESFKTGYKAGSETVYKTSINTKVQPTTRPIPTGTPMPSPALPTSTPAPTTPPTVFDKLWQIFDKIFSNREKKSMEYNETTGTVSITYGEDSTFWDETGMVESLFAVFVKFGEKVFQIDGVDSLKITLKQKLTDTYGKENVETLGQLVMDKSEFTQYNWQNLRFQPIYEQMERSASELFVHPAVLKKVNLSSIKLKY